MVTREITHKSFNYCYRIYKNVEEEFDPIFFVSGAFQNMDSWKMFSSYFMKKTTVIVADLPGVGSADFLPEEYDLDFLADCIYRILEETSIRNVYMISASYGTPISYKFAQKYPHKVSLLTMAGTMKQIPERLKKIIAKSFQFAKARNSEEFAQYVLKNGLMYYEKDAINKINRFAVVERVINRQLRAMDSLSMDKYISNTNRLLNENPLEVSTIPKLKILTFTGECDVFTTPDSCREFAMELNNSTFTTIKNADHLFHLEQTKTVIELLYRFGKGLDLECIHNCNEIEIFNQDSNSNGNLHCTTGNLNGIGVSTL